jgi:hypothetical protein
MPALSWAVVPAVMVKAVWAAVTRKLDAETATEMGMEVVKVPLVAVNERLKALAAMLSSVVICTEALAPAASVVTAVCAVTPLGAPVKESVSGALNAPWALVQDT